MNYDELIKNWHAKAINEDFFSGFVFEYLAFIAFLRKRLFQDARDDRRAIQMLKRDEEIKDEYLRRIKADEHLTGAWNNIIAELVRAQLGNVRGNGNGIDEIEWWNCDKEELNQKTQEEKQKITGGIYDLEDWINMVEFIHSIRNNLFHGGKNPEDERDQLLVSNGLIVLRPFVDIFLER